MSRELRLQWFRRAATEEDRIARESIGAIYGSVLASAKMQHPDDPVEASRVAGNVLAGITVSVLSDNGRRLMRELIALSNETGNGA